MEALQKDNTVVLTPNDMLELTLSTAVVNSFFCLAWATVVCVKFSFLALFRLLIRRISRTIGIYYWVVVVFTVLSGMFLVSEAFIMCSHFGPSASKLLVIHPVASGPLLLILKIGSKMLRKPVCSLPVNRSCMYSSRYHD